MAGEAFGLPGRPEVKAELAGLGQSMHPDAKIRMYERPARGEHAAVVLLDRVVAGVTPEYCTHGYASCVNCGQLCWLGHETERAVSAAEAYPLCLDCAREVIPPDMRPTERLEDHRRADGPHT